MSTITFIIISLIFSIASTFASIDVWLTNPFDVSLRLSRQPSLEWSKDSINNSLPFINVKGESDDLDDEEIDGVGATLSDSSAWLIWNKLNATERTELLTSFFDPREGIGLNMLILTIGTSAFALSDYTYQDECDFSIEHDLEYIIPIVKQCLEINPDLIIIAQNWSPPAWMKTSRSLRGGELEAERFEDFAVYLGKFLSEYRIEGIHIRALMVKNEPVTLEAHYPYMVMYAEEQSYFISHFLGPILKECNTKTDIIVSGQSWITLNKYAGTVLKNELTRSYVAGTAFTGHQGDVLDQHNLRENYRNKSLWLVGSSEKSEDYIDFQWPSLVKNIISVFRNYARGVINYNLVLDEDHGPQNGGCSNCLGLVTLMEGNICEQTGGVFDDESSTSPKCKESVNVVKESPYYAFGHLGKFVRKGARRIDSITSNEDIGLESLAFLNRDDRVVSLIYNDSNETIKYLIFFKKQHVAYSLPRFSLVTFVWND